MVWKVSWRRRQTATYWPKFLLTIAALLPHSGWSAQPWVTEGLSPLSGAGSHSAGILSPTATGTDWLGLTKAVCGTWLYFCLTHTCFLWAYASATITDFNLIPGQGDIPISSTGCTCFAVLPLIYTGTSLDWQFGRGSIYDFRGSQHSLTFQYNWSLTTRLFCVIIRTLVGEVLTLCRDAVGVFYSRAPTGQKKKSYVRNWLFFNSCKINAIIAN